MKRVAFTILLNGRHHLEHNNFFNEMLNKFDLWVIVEGVANPGGSTSWCREPDEDFHKKFLSVDGTTEFLDNNKHNKLVVVRPDNRAWMSKDEQVNRAIKVVKEKYNECFLWQVDVDEQWSLEQLEEAEKILKEKNGKTGCFICNYFVGKNQQVFGEWGECTIDTYRRLWHWEGEEFETHEPPKLKGKNGPGFLLPQRFNHYSYYFEQDVKFKEAYYGGYEGLLERWKRVQANRDTIHIRELLGPELRWSYTNTIIKYTNDN